MNPIVFKEMLKVAFNPMDAARVLRAAAPRIKKMPSDPDAKKSLGVSDDQGGFFGINQHVNKDMRLRNKGLDLSDEDVGYAADYYKSHLAGHGLSPGDIIAPSGGSRLRGGELRPLVEGGHMSPWEIRRLNPDDRRTLKGILVGHELDEAVVHPKESMRSLLGLKGYNHNSPEVYLRESNRVATLPAAQDRVRNIMNNMRRDRGEEWTVQDVLPDFRYGETRLNRRQIRHITNRLEALNR